MRICLLSITLLVTTLSRVEGFGIYSFSVCRGRNNNVIRLQTTKQADATDGDDTPLLDSVKRRNLLASIIMTPSLAFMGAVDAQIANAAVGSLPELADTNAILQGITVQVADKSQETAMVSFLTEAFDFRILRQRIRGPIEETWLGYGPEQLSIPADFELPVSSFSQYGGHASIRLVYDSRIKAPLYRIGDSEPGNNLAYLQVAVPGYRISKMIANGGNILDAYGHVEVVSPSGLPIRGIVGIAPDPIMFAAITCANVQASKSYYQKLGFVELDVPYARPSKGTTPFEPAPPKGSVYMAPSPNCMGVLLIPAGKKKKIVPNPVVDSLNLVYSPSPDAEGQDVPPITDPSGISITFQAVKEFEAEEKATR